MSELTSRFALPLLASGQAQKEITHNEALLLLDALAHPAIESRSLASPPSSPLPGQIWLVADTPTGAWVGKASHLALWTSGGWRYIAPQIGMALWSKPDQAFILFVDTGWQFGAWPVMQLWIAGQRVVAERQPAIVNPTGGTTTDIQSRDAITNILNAMRAHGLIMP